MKCPFFALLARFGVLLIVVLALLTPAWAYTNLAGFGPKSYKNGVTYGNAVFFAPHHLILREAPAADAPVVDEFYWDKSFARQGTVGIASRLKNRYVSSHSLFFAFYPEVDVAMMAVVGDSAGDGVEDGPVRWVEVIYDQKTGKTAWVALAHPEGEADAASHLGTTMTWLDFMKHNARAHGVYWLTGVSNYQRSLRTSDKDEASLIEVTVIRDLKVKHIRGNWMLVEVLDFERNTPIGWMRWRDNDGNLLVFPNLSHEKLPIVIPAGH